MGCKDQKMKQKLNKIIDIYEDAECSKVAEIRCLEIVKDNLQSVQDTFLRSGALMIANAVMLISNFDLCDFVGMDENCC